MDKIFPKAGERFLFLGMSGSGKTTLAVTMLRRLIGITQIDILDSKIEPAFDSLPGSEILETFDEVRFSTALVRIYRPTSEELLDNENIDNYLKWRYQDAPGLTYIDEVLSLGIQTKARPGFLSLLTRGRSRQASCWMASQRPAWIGRFAFSETNCFAVFRLNDLKDRQRVSQFTSSQLLNQPSDKYGFWYYKIGDNAPIEYKRIKSFKIERKGGL